MLAPNLGIRGQTVKAIALEQLVPEAADMRTVILVGSTQTRTIQWCDGGVWIYRPRRYTDESVAGIILDGKLWFGK